MNINFVTNAYGIVVYIISYVTKAVTEIGLLLTPKKKQQNNLSAKEALKKVGNVYLHKMEVCVVFVVFVQTWSYIVKGSLPLSILKQQVACSEIRTEDMWMTNIVDRYKNRPDNDVFDDMCMAMFASEYCVLSKTEKSNNTIELKNGLGFILRKIRFQFIVVCYMHFDLEKQEDAHFQSLLQLFLPYRAESDLRPEGFELFSSIKMVM